MKNLIQNSIVLLLLLLTTGLLAQNTKLNPIQIHQNAATSGQVLKWNGSAWAPAVDLGSPGDPASYNSYNTNDTLTLNRTVTMASKNITLDGIGRQETRFNGGTIFMKTDTSTQAAPFADTLLFIQPANTHPHVNSPFVIGVEDATNNGPTYIYPNRVWWWGVNNRGSGTAYNTDGMMWGDVIESSWVSGDVPFYERHNAFKMPGKDALRVQSWTFQHPNTYYGTGTFALDYYQIGNSFALRGAKNEVGSGYTHTDYFGVGFNPTAGLASMSLVLNPTNGFNIQGTGSDAVAYLSVTGAGTKRLSFEGNDQVTFGSASFNNATETFTADYFNANVGLYGPRIQVGAGLGATTGLWQASNVRLMAVHTNQVDLFIGGAAGPSSNATLTGAENIGIGYLALNGLTSGSRNTVLGTYAARYHSTTSGSVIIGYEAATLAENNLGAPLTKSIIIGDSCMRSPSFNPANMLIIENSPSNTPLVSADFATNRFGVNVVGTTKPQAALHVNSLLATTVKVARFENATVNADLFAVSATPEGSVTADLGDIALSTAGVAYLKESGSGTNTGWGAILTTGAGALLPSGTNTQTLRNNSGTWTANSQITNDGSTVGIGGAPGTEELTVYGPILASAGRIRSSGTGDASGSSAAPGVRMDNTTPTTGRVWDFASMNGGQLRLYNSNLGSIPSGRWYAGGAYYNYGIGVFGPAHHTAGSDAGVIVGADSTNNLRASVIENRMDNSGAHAMFYAKNGGTSGGDAGILMETAGGGGYHMAIDNSVSGEPLRIGASLTAGTTDALEINSSGLISAMNLTKTITAGGTTGDQTINNLHGSVNFAAAASTLVVTNSLVTTSSNVFLQVYGTDATATSARVTLASGSFTITLNAAATAETKVGFRVVN